MLLRHVTAIALVLLANAMPSAAQQIVDIKINVADSAMPANLDPTSVTSTSDLRWGRIGHQFLALVHPLDHSQIVPELLASLEPLSASDYEKGVLQYKLRADAFWSWWDSKESQWDKRPVRAEDVVYSWQHIRSLDVSVYTEKARFFRSVTASGNDIIVFRTAEARSVTTAEDKKSLARLVATNLTFPIIPDPAYIAYRVKDGPGWQIGSGAYQLTKAEIGKSALYRANPNFATSAKIGHTWFDKTAFAKQFYIEQMTDVTMATNKITSSMIPEFHIITDAPLNQYRKISSSSNTRYSVNMERHNTNNFSYVGYNARKFPTKLRLALTYAIDRGTIFKSAYGAVSGSTRETLDSLVNSPYPDAVLGKINPIPFDPKQAQALIRQAKNDPDPKLKAAYADLVNAKIRLVYFKRDEFDEKIVTDVRTQLLNAWRQVEPNVDIDLDLISSYAKFQTTLRKHDFDIVYHSWSFQSDTDNVSLLLSENSPYNYTLFNVSPSASYPGNAPSLELNPAISNLIRQHDRSVNSDVRLKLRRQIAEALLKDAPYTFLFKIPYFMVYREDYVTINRSAVQDFNLFYYLFTWRALNPD